MRSHRINDDDPKKCAGGGGAEIRKKKKKEEREKKITLEDKSTAVTESQQLSSSGGNMTKKHIRKPKENRRPCIRANSLHNWNNEYMYSISYTTRKNRGDIQRTTASHSLCVFYLDF